MINIQFQPMKYLKQDNDISFIICMSRTLHPGDNDKSDQFD